MLSRHGKFNKGIHPWIKAPLTGAPVKYYGWHWDPAKKLWVEDDVRKIEVEVKVPVYLRPVGPPRPAQPFYVPGWYWNGRAGLWEIAPLSEQEIGDGIEAGPKPEYVPAVAEPTEVEGWSWSDTHQEWIATMIIAEKVGFEPPRSLPPGVDLASVFPVDPYFEASVRAARRLVELGRWDILANGDAYFKLVAQTHRLCPAAKYPHLIAEGVFESRAIMHAKRVWLSSEEAWKIRINELAPANQDLISKIGTHAFVVGVAALVGFLIGTIMERMAWPEGEIVGLYPAIRTWLMGPGHWNYANHIGTSRGDSQYYSICDDIGTDYTRHWRGLPGAYRDTIDFPGGFLEKGFKDGFFVKYNWILWHIEYIGMLASVGGNFYVLKKGNYDGKTLLRPGQMLPVEQWCPDFRTYL